METRLLAIIFYIIVYRILASFPMPLSLTEFHLMLGLAKYCGALEESRGWSSTHPNLREYFGCKKILKEKENV